jgi:PIN domain nuclease of toxin-antitoxin system
MIVLDTHIWIWLVNNDKNLPESTRKIIIENEQSGLGISIISCWEVAKLVEVGRLKINLPIKDWIEQALKYPGIRLIPLSLDIVIDSTQLPGNFHKDPADQMIVSTSRILQYPLLSMDSKILNYAHVQNV